MDPYTITRGRTILEQEEFDNLLPIEVCEHCNVGVEANHIENVEGYKLCPDCTITFKKQVEEDLRERALQMAMDNLPTDQLMTLKWCLANTFTQIQDKSGCDNIHLWNNRVDEALKTKK